ncbi:MAG: phosphotransferase, partial [Novosphingobium sp.]
AQMPPCPGQDAAYAQACARSAAAAGAQVHDAATALTPLRRMPEDDALLNAIIEQLHIVHLASLDPTDHPASAAEGTGRWLAAWRDYWRGLDMASPGVSRALHLLEASLPGEDAPAGRVHGGCDADRILVAADGSVVLDGWEANHWGDPVEDLADLIVALEDQWPAAVVVRAYEQCIGAIVPAFHLAWFGLFARVKQVIAGYGALAMLQPGCVPDAAALAAAARQLRPAIAALLTHASATTPSMR